MDFHRVIDRSQVLWAIKEAIKKEFPEKCKGKEPGAATINAIWETAINSPAYGIQGVNVIYLQKQIPEDFLPMILNHEELHLLVYQVVKADMQKSTAYQSLFVLEFDDKKMIIKGWKRKP